MNTHTHNYSIEAYSQLGADFREPDSTENDIHCYSKAMEKGWELSRNYPNGAVVVMDMMGNYENRRDLPFRIICNGKTLLETKKSIFNSICIKLGLSWPSNNNL